MYDALPVPYRHMRPAQHLDTGGGECAGLARGHLCGGNWQRGCGISYLTGTAGQLVFPDRLVNLELRLHRRIIIVSRQRNQVWDRLNLLRHADNRRSDSKFNES